MKRRAPIVNREIYTVQHPSAVYGLSQFAMGYSTAKMDLTNDRVEEELAGSPMMCLHPDGYRWVLAGVSNWRIACSKIGDQRPRLYDQTISNVEWIKSTMAGN
ncbi:unnamed protein product [Nesidiocoris tenuis]|uniref:Peptidase S1 domain-containing protein n=1 Tax=Nesidiocoris tenuis TaxID=355587 RepID=A0A6H5GUM4_9HEMI|nr:unnamed protein product [Nesidiocoris tenuis]